MPTINNNAESRSISVIAAEIKKDWVKPYFGAVPYIEALTELDKITDSYCLDSAAMMITYFLANAQTWRGEVARRIKNELQGMVNEFYRTK